VEEAVELVDGPFERGVRALGAREDDAPSQTGDEAAPGACVVFVLIFLM
jgi:hypothetical protein